MKLISMKCSMLGGGKANREGWLNERRNILFARFALSGFFVVVAHVIQDAIQGLALGTGIDAFIGLVVLSSFVLNEKGRHFAAKTILLTFLNFTLAIYCSLIPKHNGVYLFYFPLIGLSSVVFDFRHRNWGLFFVGLSGASLIALLMTDFKLLGDLALPAIPEQDSFLINLTSSSLVLMLCIHFIMKYNDESERRLMNLAAEIRQKNMNLEKTNLELDRFVYSASHDLRAPLLSIQGVVNIARNEIAATKMEEYLTMIHNQAVKLDLFIKDIICYSRNTRTEVAKDTVNVHQLLEEVREDLKFMKGAEGIRWEKEIEEHLSLTTDKLRMVAVFNNLISNAIKYHRRDRNERWIKIAVRKNALNCWISVRDNGLGISREHQSRIFDMFYRAHEHSTGSGLGLYIVKEIVAKMNGEIHVLSQPGLGSTFTITFPLAAA